MVEPAERHAAEDDGDDTRVRARRRIDHAHRYVGDPVTVDVTDVGESRFVEPAGRARTQPGEAALREARSAGQV